ncbi:MAG: LPS export ABC transporter periplasmic protein LptC [Kangiellaceae bacterium]|nr:LPS export ABC transporter periplasmic protein LptC [Kangiellaceae bacterium]
MTFLKGRSILWLLIPAAFVVPFLWDWSEKPKPVFLEESSNPDYYLTNTQTIEFNSQGQVARRFSSDKTLHYIDIAQTHLQSPKLSMSTEQNQQWHVSANSAISNELSEQLTLDGMVEITFESQRQSNAVLSMPKLLIDFASQTASTAEPLRLETDLYLLTATGMDADLQKNTIEFKSEVISQEK